MKRAGIRAYLRAAFSYIADELRRQYSLGYYPRQVAQPGERRNIKVRLWERRHLAYIVRGHAASRRDACAPRPLVRVALVLAMR
jgi:hypothetical protein